MAETETEREAKALLGHASALAGWAADTGASTGIVGKDAEDVEIVKKLDTDSPTIIEAVGKDIVVTERSVVRIPHLGQRSALPFFLTPLLYVTQIFMLSS